MKNTITDKEILGELVGLSCEGSVKVGHYKNKDGSVTKATVEVNSRDCGYMTSGEVEAAKALLKLQSLICKSE